MGLNEELARKMKELLNLNNKVSTPGSSKGSSNSYQVQKSRELLKQQISKQKLAVSKETKALESTLNSAINAYDEMSE